MKYFRKRSILFALSLSSLGAISAQAQQPVIGGVLNSASYSLPGLPNAALAQGSIVAIFGTNLGPANLAPSPGYPIPTNLAGTSAAITVNGSTISLPIFYTVAGQVAAIIPSKVPTGTGTVTITYNGQTSAPLTVTVAPSSFGLYSLNSKGNGPAVATFADYSVIKASHPAHNGDTIVFWGTGLGPISTDDAAAPAPGNLTNIAIQAYVGGQPATVTYHGRSGCCAGLDQIVLTVPPSVQGCNVPVVIQTGNVISNYTTIATAPPGQNTCTDPASPFTGSAFDKFLNGGTLSYGIVFLSRTSTFSNIPLLGPQTTTSDDGEAFFSKITIPASTAGSGTLPSNLVSSVSVGACTVTTINVSLGSTGTAPPASDYAFTSLDAGPSVGISGPNGARTLAKTSTAGFTFYSAMLGNGTPGNYLDAGNYTATGTGGADVGAFSAAITQAPPLTWTNQSSISTVNRSAGQLITWTGGDPAGYVTITGSSSFITADNKSYIGSTFECMAKASDQTFTIPSVVLLSLPAGQTTTVGGTSFSTPGSLDLSAATQYQTFTAPGLDLGLIYASSGAYSSVVYQ